MKRQVSRFIDHYFDMVLARFVATFLRREDYWHRPGTGPVWIRRTARAGKVTEP